MPNLGRGVWRGAMLLQLRGQEPPGSQTGWSRSSAEPASAHLCPARVCGGSTPSPPRVPVLPGLCLSLSPLPRPALAFPMNRASGALLRGPLAGSVLVRSLLWGRRVTLGGPRGLAAGRPGCGPGPAWLGHLLSLQSGGWQACPRAQCQPRVLRERRVRAAARLGLSAPWRCLVSCRDSCVRVCGPAPVSQCRPRLRLRVGAGAGGAGLRSGQAARPVGPSLGAAVLGLESPWTHLRA